MREKSLSRPKEEILQEWIKERLQPEAKKISPNGGKPFESRIVSEDELTGNLDERCDLVKELTSGKIMIRRRLE